ncbi:MAG: ATP-dependent DNA helicase RecG [Gemmataceae bacterium]|nr:ATP-dependent DNA helicase RecG [Gemmataceae bacterium]
MPDREPLQQPVQFLKGVGPARAETLGKLGIATVGDLIFHFPRSYDDLSDLRTINQLTAGELQTVAGEVVELGSKELPDGRTILNVVIADAHGACLEGSWFNQVAPARQFRYGLRVAFSGKPKWFRDHWQMNHPRVQILDDQSEAPANQVVPVYPLTEGLHPEKLRDLIRQALAVGGDHVPDLLPPGLRDKHRYPPAPQALQHVHFPEILGQALQAKRRFIYEEFLILQVALAARRRDTHDRGRAAPLPADTDIDARIRRLFPFALTNDQNRAIREICKDLAQDRPMQRLLQADVGAGKTAVAVYAMLVAIAHKHQAALMAPTEVLARQHWLTLEGYLAHSRVRRLLLTGSLSAKARQEALRDIRAGNVDLVVGTQALVQDDVEFARLGLAVVDEQHKFGVAQRARIRKLGADPHYLVMTATPIPRTIALTVFGDLDLSIIRELPPGRHGVQTRWSSAKDRDKLYEHFRQQLRQGRQAYVVCPLVAESETLDLTAAEQLHAELKEGAFRDFRIGLLHGRMKDDAKDEIMRQFRERELDLLVTTVVIEVGVDVPNATLMLIEHAERFGLSQLHQLRGRVSRGAVAGECWLLAGMTSGDADVRLRAFTRTSDGFALAEEDARLRGLGEFFGTRQHGLGELRFGNLIDDQALLVQARTDAIDLATRDPQLKLPDHSRLRDAVLARYGKTLDLAAIG